MDQVAYLILAIITALTGGGFIGKKISDARRVTVDPQPFMVKMEEKFVTREDFKEYKAESGLSFAKLEGLFRQTMTMIDERDRATMAKIDARDSATMAKIDERDEKLSSKLEAAVDKGASGRVHIWNDIRDEKERVNARFGELGQRIAKVETSTDIGRVLERGIETLTKKSVRGQ